MVGNVNPNPQTISPNLLESGEADTPVRGNSAPTPNTAQALNLLEDFANELASLAESGDLRAPSSDDGVINSRGLPALSPPNKEFSASDMADLLRALQTISQNAQLKTAKENIESNKIEQQKNNEKQMDKINEWVQKCKEAQKSGLFGKIFGWVGAILALVAAVALTVATAGTAGPVMMAVAGIALASAISMVATQISAELGGPEISISSVISMVVGKMLEAFGIESELAEKIANIVAGAGMMLCPATLLVDPAALGKMAGAIASVAGASPETAGYIAMGVGLAATLTAGIILTVATAGAGGASTAGNVASKIGPATARNLKGAAQIASGAASVAKGAGNIADGAENIKTAEAQKNAEKALAAKKELEALMARLQASMEEDREKLKEILMAMDESMRMVTQIIGAEADSISQIAENIGKRAMV